MEKAAEIKEALGSRNGTGIYHNFNIGENLYTDGIKEMATLCSASWLVTDALLVCKSLSKKEYFISVKFRYTPELKTSGIVAQVTYDDGNGNSLYTEDIIVTDFPLEKFQMIYENNVLYLPSER